MGELGKKVIVELTVGLGNQLFQYALGRHISVINDAKLYFDLSRSKMDAASYDMRNNVFDLGNFQIEGKVWEGHKLNHDKKIFGIQKLLFGEKFKVIKEELFVYDDSVFEKTNKSIHLLGFWQSEKYFKPISKRLKMNYNLRMEHLRESMKKYKMKYYQQMQSLFMFAELIM